MILLIIEHHNIVIQHWLFISYQESYDGYDQMIMEREAITKFETN